MEFSDDEVRFCSSALTHSSSPDAEAFRFKICMLGLIPYHCQDLNGTLVVISAMEV